MVGTILFRKFVFPPKTDKRTIYTKILMRNILLTLFGIFGVYGLSTAQMSGTYTIGGAGASFSSVVQAVDTLNTNGVSGPVTFNIRTGTYVGTVKINTVAGTSASNKVTFRPDPSNSGQVIIEDSSLSTSNPGSLILNGSRYIEFDSLTIRTRPISGTPTSGCAVEFQGSSQYITFKGCYLTGYNTASTSNYLAAVFDNTGTGNMAQYITFDGNTISGGSYGMYIYGGSTATRQQGWVLKDNRIINFNYMGILSYYLDGAEFKGNFFQRASSLSYPYPYGLYGYYNYNTDVVENSFDIDASVYSQGGIYWRYCFGTSSNRSTIANNMVHTRTGIYGAYFYYCNYNDIVFNTIKTDRAGGNTTYYGTYLYQGTATTFQNNNVVNSGGSYALNVSGTHTRTNNNLYSSNSNHILGGTLGANSMSVDPQFLGTNDLHIKNAALFGAAVAFTGITTDIDGDTRRTVPCIGADEFLPDTLDGALLSIKSNYCPTTNAVTVPLQNLGLDTITSASISWSIAKNGGTPVAQPTTSYTGSISTGRVGVVSLGNYTFTADTTYQIWARLDSVNHSKDKLASNDSSQTDTFRTSLFGTYFVGGSNPDFATVSDAVNALNASGVCAATTIKIRTGTYNSQLYLKDVPGLSSTNTLRFTADSGASPVITDTATSFTIILEGMNNVTFDHLTIKNEFLGGTVVSLEKENADITIDSCYLWTDTVANSSSCRVITNNSGNNLKRLTVSNSTLVGGYISIFLYGNGQTSQDSSFKLLNSTLSQFYYYGLYSFYQTNMIVQNSTIDNMDRVGFPSNQVFGIYAYYTDHFNINANYIRVNAISTPYTVYLYYSDGTPTDRSQFVNNMLLSPRTTYPSSSRMYSCYVYNCLNLDFYFNNILLKEGGPQSYAAYLYGTGLIARNNNVVHGGTGFGIGKIGTIAETHNNIYTPNGTPTNTVQGANGLNVDPEYVSDADLHVGSISLNNSAFSIAGITTDFDGDSRGTTTDIGADEFTPPANDVRPYILLSPSTGGCGQDSATVEVIIKNNGTASQSNIPVTVYMYGINSDTLTGTSTRSISSNTTDTVTVGKVNTSAGGRYRFVLITSLSGDQRNENDTIEVNNVKVDRSPLDPVIGANVVVCSGIDTVLVNHSAARQSRWYDAPTGGNLLHVGDSFKVNLTAADTFWVMGSDDYEVHVGLPNNNGTGANWTSMNYGLQFDVLRPLTLDSVTVFPNAAGSVTVRLLNSVGNVLRTRTVPVTSGGTFQIPVGFNVAPGKGYVLDAAGTNTGGLWRTYGYPPYPFRDIDSSIFITGDQSGGDYSYYFFYDWKLSVEGCESGLSQVPVNVRPSLNINLGNDTAYCTGSSFNLTLNTTTSGAVAYKWQNGSTSASQTLTTKGTYHVAVTSNNSCVSRDTIEVVEVPQPNVVFNDTGVCDNQGLAVLTGRPYGGTISGFGVVNGKFDPVTAGLGNHTVTYNYSDAIGCIGSNNATITVKQSPTAGFTSPGTVCQNKKTPFALSGGSPVGPSGYYFGQNVQANKYLPRVAGLDTVYYVFFNAQSCKDTAAATITIQPAPNVLFDTLPLLICNNTPVISLNATPAGGTYSGTGVTGNQFDPSVAGVGSNSVSYSATGANSCVTVETQNITILQAPSVTLDDLAPACEYDFVITLTGGLPTRGKYYGQFANPNNSKFDVLAAGVGVYPITYIYEEFNGCIDSVTKNLEVLETPNAKFGGDKQICGTHPVILDAGAATSYRWNTSDTTRTISVLRQGNYKVTITNATCVGTDSVGVTYEAVCVGVPEALRGHVDVKYYPVPANHSLNMSLVGFDGMDISLEITTVSGQVVMKEELGRISESEYIHGVDVTSLCEGMYIARIRTSKGDIVHRISVSH